jgi:hypothetical protein
MLNSRQFLSAILIASMAVIAGPTHVQARPAHKRALADYFGPFLAKKLNDCRTCHLPGKGGSIVEETEKPHNAFGARLAAVKKALKRAGKSTDIPARLEAIALEDSDGDGVANLIEILSGHFPGDPKDTPTPAEIETAKKTLLAFRESQRGYQWRPFETVVRPAVPKAKNSTWVRNPVDAFLAVEQEARKLKPRPEAPKHVLLRRIYLDLIGLPPTPAELAAFVNDTSPDAYQKVVNRLLDSPQYGERWGRHWMDIWRYSDWAGYGPEVRDSQPHIWRWRDWIVESVNRDKDYDRMILEMLAGDELAPEDPQVLRATGFLVRNWYKFNRTVWLDRTVEHTAKAFLGVTLNCARCHDHFYDPIAQKEYYQFRAFFEPHNIRTDRVPGQLDTAKDGIVRVYDANLKPQTFLFIRGEDKNPDKKKPLEPAALSALGWEDQAIELIKLPGSASHPDKQGFVIKELLAAGDVAIAKSKEVRSKAKSPEAEALADLDVQLAQAKQTVLQSVLRAEALEDAGDKGEAWKKIATETVLSQRRANLLEARRTLMAAHQAQEKADPKTKPAVLKKVQEAEKALVVAEQAEKQPPTTSYTPRKMASYPATSTGRRLALARWIADRKNPLTARVAMNHIWLRHFGQALVPSVFDFGRNGQPASHPALLDWLAAEFMQQKWSMKAMHRLLVTSSAYRMAATTDPDNAALDPDNRYLWRMNSKRMEAEIVRDSVLAVAGQLDRTLGGPELDHNLGLTTRRRSLYYRHAPEKMMEFLTLFDNANVTECYRRTESIVPQQALALSNSTLVLAQARLLARKLAQSIGPVTPATQSAFVKAGFEHVLCRPPTVQEQAFCQEFLEKQVKLLAQQKGLTPFTGGAPSPVPPAADPQLRAREDLIHVLFNHNEFVTIR